MLIWDSKTVHTDPQAIEGDESANKCTLWVWGLCFGGVQSRAVFSERAKHREEKTLTGNFSKSDEIY